MKLFQLAIAILLSATAFAQVTAQCPACALGPLSYTAKVNTDSVAHGVILNNTSTTALPMTWSVTGQGFLPGGGTTCKQGSINPGKCTISLKFHPTVVGTVTGKLSINVGTSTAITMTPLTAVPLDGTATQTIASVQLGWKAPLSDGAASYNLYRGGVKVGSVTGSVLTFTDATVPSGTYQYTARTVDSSGRESVDSNVVTVTIL